MEMREHRQGRDEITNQVTSGVAEEGAGMREVRGNEPEKGSRDEKAQRTDEVMAGEGGMEGEDEGTDHPQAGTQAVHIVSEIKRVDQRQEPQDGDHVADEGAGDEERDASAGEGDE